MLHTLAEARTVVGRFVGSGTCNASTINDAINEALERLLDLQPWECLKKNIRITTCKNCIALPYEVEAVLAVDIDSVPGRAFGQMYQFLSSGPGDLSTHSHLSGTRDLMDLGDQWPVMYDVPDRYPIDTNSDNDVFPEGMPIAAFSTDGADTVHSLTVVGKNFKNEDITEDLPIQKWHGGVEGELRGRWNRILKLSTNNFKEITRVIKPATKGYVCAYAVDSSRDFMFLLAKYHPKQTIPGFRRYRITNKSYGEFSSILAMVRLRHVPLVSDNDILPIDSIQPLKLMVMAITAENAKDAQNAAIYMGAAQAAMTKREEAKTTTMGTPVILNMDYRTSIGRKINGRGCI